jgi:hypothetical protein
MCEAFAKTWPKECRIQPSDRCVKIVIPSYKQHGNLQVACTLSADKERVMLNTKSKLIEHLDGQWFAEGAPSTFELPCLPKKTVRTWHWFEDGPRIYYNEDTGPVKTILGTAEEGHAQVVVNAKSRSDQIEALTALAMNWRYNV